MNERRKQVMEEKREKIIAAVEAATAWEVLILERVVAVICQGGEEEKEGT